MDTTELRAALTSSNVPADMYSLYGDRDETYCLLREADAWVVYYSERGKRNGERHYLAEEDACADLMDRLLREVERNAGW